MNRIFKTLLLWLLLAALPMQGFAAAALACCDPEHHVISQSSTLAQQLPDQHDGHHHAEHLAAAADQAMTDGASDAGNAAAGHDHESTTCSACNACCVGGVMPFSGVNWMPESHSSEKLLISTSPFFTGFIPAGLERPPRQISA